MVKSIVSFFVASVNAINMHHTPCHSIYRVYCGYGRPTRDAWPNPVNSSSDDEFVVEAHTLRMLIVRIDPLEEDTIFMNEFQMITEVLYNIPEANLYASTSKDANSKRLCAIQIYKIMPDFASLEVRVMISGTKRTFSLYSYYSMDANAISPTQISLLDQHDLSREASATGARVRFQELLRSKNSQQRKQQKPGFLL
uniref:Uncharacterized protein n=1 Tax=Ixodes ricinus TaxID=34613 RepID=V5GNW1_IXORI